MTTWAPSSQRLVLAASLGAAIACGDGVAPPPVVATISLIPSQSTTCPSDTARFQATARESNGRPITGTTLTWSSSQSAVATVDQSGLVTAVAGGVTLIRAAHGAVHGEAQFVVLAPHVVFAYTYPSLFVGDTTQLHATVTDLNGLAPPAPPSAWVSHAPAVATVSSEAVVTGQQTGPADIAAQGACGVEGVVTVVVLAPRVGIEREVAYIADTLRSDSVSIDQAKTALGTGGMRLISAPGEYVTEFAWAHDGSRIVLTYSAVNGVGRSGSYVANPDGSGEAPLGAYLWSPDWSPDGSRILYRNYIATGESDVYSMQADGSDVRLLTSAPGDDLEPRWSPDGRQVLYTRAYSAPTPELWIMAADSSDRRRVTLPTGALNPRWSPDGKYIAFDNGLGIWEVNADGTNPRPLTANCVSGGVCSSTETYRYPSWSPTGQRIAYAKYAPAAEVVIANADGTGATGTPVPASCCFPLAPQWSPAGDRVTFAGTKPDTWPGVGVMGADGTGLVWISGSENAGRPMWRP